MKNIKTLTLAATLPILMMGSFAIAGGLQSQPSRKNEAIVYEADNLNETPELAIGNILSAISIGE